MRIKEARKKNNMTQKELADAIGVDFTVISKYEKGTVTPPAKRLEAISKVLGESIDYLVSDDLLIENNKQTKNIEDKESLESDLILDRESLLYKRLLIYAKGLCELCKHNAPFEMDGEPYLELHQLTSMSDGGLPVPENTVLLCPNCHTKIHQLKDSKDLEELNRVASNHKEQKKKHNN